jgi:hypothetical protein
MTARPYHLTDAEPVSEDAAKSLAEITSPMPHVTIRIVAGRPAIAHYPTLEPCQFLTNGSPQHVRWLAQSWSDRFAADAEKGRAR